MKWRVEIRYSVDTNGEGWPHGYAGFVEVDDLATSNIEAAIRSTYRGIGPNDVVDITYVEARTIPQYSRTAPHFPGDPLGAVRS